MIVFTESHNSMLKTVSKLERFENDIVIMISFRENGSFLLKTQTFENNAPTTTNYSNFFTRKQQISSGFSRLQSF